MSRNMTALVQLAVELKRQISTSKPTNKGRFPLRARRRGGQSATSGNVPAAGSGKTSVEDVACSLTRDRHFEAEGRADVKGLSWRDAAHSTRDR